LPRLPGDIGGRTDGRGKTRYLTALRTNQDRAGHQTENAEVLGLAIPPIFLMQADAVIE
jgi:hypothetical protein